MRSRKRKWTQKELENNSGIIQNPELFKGKWSDYFNNSNPIHIEIGCGKGRFINENAARNENINYIALEREKEVIVVGAKRARVENNNVAFIIGDATNLLDYFDKSELARIYLNFSDPWQNRKKWQKRRLTHRNFLNLYNEILDETGEIFVKTDNQQLFEFSLNEFCDLDFKLSNITLNLHKSEYEGNIMTEYEERFFSLGMPIYRVEARKRRV